MDNKIFLSSTDFDFKGKTVLVRIDCDVDLVEAASVPLAGGTSASQGKFVVDEDFRLRTVLPSIKFLQEKEVEKIVLMGHIGRPDGQVVKELSLAPVEKKLRELGVGENVSLLENLRFNSGEEENCEEFAKKLAGLGDVYINEAFGVSHRQHASIVGIPKFLPSFLGLRFEEEMKVLTRLRQGFGEARRPLVFVLGGSKEDKVDYLPFLGEWCDKVLVGGKLPLQIKNLKLDLPAGKAGIKNLVFAELNKNDKDINEKSIKEFIQWINSAKTVVWAGPMGVYEEPENQLGTYEIARAVAESLAFKVAGGGDTHRILSRLGLWGKFDFVSVAGGAMLYYLEKENLPGIEAVQK